jgi:hypothetical protein
MTNVAAKMATSNFYLVATVLALAAQNARAGAAISYERSSAAEQMRIQLQDRDVEHKKSVAAIMNNMTVNSALQVLRVKNAHTNRNLLAFVEETLQVGHGHSRGKAHAKQQEQSSSMHLRAGGKSTQTPASGVDKAKFMLNEMIEETMTKYDMELQTCCKYQISQNLLIEEARQDISTYNAVAAEARKEVLEAETLIQICETKLPELHDALETHNNDCKDELLSLRNQLGMVANDLTVMDRILAMTTCASTSLLLVKCQDACTGETFVSFKHDGMRSNATLLQSAAARQMLNDTLAEAYNGEDKYTPGTNLTTYSPHKLPDMTITRSGPCKERKMADKRTSKCSMSTNPDCQKMREKFSYIQAGIEDKRDELQEQLGNLAGDCELMRHNLESQIGDFESKLKDVQTALAIGTKKQNIAEGQSRLKNKELFVLQEDFAKMTERCHQNYETLESEDCGLKKIRGELAKMSGSSSFFQDCVVAEWRPSECSASCAGGSMHLTRTIITKADGGAKCPVLSAIQPCNEKKCPIDCKLRDWQGWSECSAKCGGGIMERARRVEVEELHGGEPCGETSEAEACNLQACDKDCHLNDWSSWSDCSKECDTGSIERMRAIATPAVGDGHCPDIRSVERFEEKECNRFACVKTNPSTTLQCESSLDVILVIDGSGSLGQTGWDASKAGGALLARAFNGAKKGVQLAVLLFSYKSEWVTHFTSDIESAAVAIEGMQWPRSITKTANALNTARSELSMGREWAKSIVIVITDGKPMSLRQTRSAAEVLRRQARLMWVPVTRYAPLDTMKKWASYPVEENFLSLSDFSGLTDPENVNLIIADICQSVD